MAKTANLIDKIEYEMSTDDDNREVQSIYLKNRYLASNKKVREGIDACFVALCGWSLETLIKR